VNRIAKPRRVVDRQGRPNRKIQRLAFSIRKRVPGIDTVDNSVGNRVVAQRRASCQQIGKHESA
jgi:hypothetical protein